MAKTKLTQMLEKAIYYETSKMGTFGCFEVTIGWYGKERVDYMTYNTKGEIRCYEIKVSKADFNSQNHNTFCGHFNYYVMPYELYEAVKDDIPKGIGVYACNVRSGKAWAHNERKAKRQEATVDAELLKDYLIRSLSREVNKQIKSGDPLVIERKDREINRLKRERDNYYHECWDLRKKFDPAYKV